MTTIPFTLLMQGDILGALSYIFTNYMAYGIMWIIFGGLVFAVVYGNTKSYGISGMMFIIYSVVSGALIPVEMQPYFLLLIGFLIAVLMIKVLK